MRRVFIAVRTDPADDLMKMLSSIKDHTINDRIKWVDPSGFHITLVFLGEIPGARIRMLDRMLREKCTGFGNFDFVLSGAGVFGSRSDPKVLWVGISQAERLYSLYEIISERLMESRFEIEDRKFRPHLTIGRVKSVSDPEGLRSLMNKYDGREFQKVSVKEIILFESILQKAGPLYTPLAVYPL